MPSGHSLAMRFVVVTTTVLILAWFSQRAFLPITAPLFELTLRAVQDDFDLTSVDIVQDGTLQTLRVRADLARPVTIGGRTFYPLNWKIQTGQAQGWYEIVFNASGIFQYGLITLIVVLAWPCRNRTTAMRRVLLAMPCALMLALINIAITIPAELWTPFHHEWVPEQCWPLLVASRMLMGGGGIVLGILTGIAVIHITASPKALSRHSPDQGRPQLVAS